MEFPVSNLGPIPAYNSSVTIQEEVGGNGDDESCSGQGQGSTTTATICSPSPSSNGDLNSIFHGTGLQHSRLRTELEERAMQIAELKLQLIQAMRSHYNVQRDLLNCSSAADTAGSTSMIMEIEPPNFNSTMLDQESRLGRSRIQFGVDVDDGADEHGSFTQGLVEWADTINRQQVVARVGKGTVAMSHLVLGDLTGWTAAYLVQKFGKIAVTAIGGGLVLLQFAHHKGYILVNWSTIYNQLEAAAAEDNEELVDDWVVSKVKSFKGWAKNNTYVVVGFLCGFLYKSFR